MTIFRNLFFALLLLFIISCSTNVSDGGTDFPNTKTVSGLIKNTDGKFTDSIYVYVVPEDYRLDVKLPVIYDYRTGTITDSNGFYKLEVVDSQSYNILALDLRKRDRLLHRGLSVKGIDIDVDTLSITPNGSLIVPINGYSIGYFDLVIMGTDYEPNIYDNYAVFDSLPEGIYSKVLLFGEEIADSVEIKSQETIALGDALLIVKYTDGNIDSNDVSIIKKIEKTGLTITVVNQDSIKLTDTNGIDLICISTSVDQDSIGDFYTNMNKPLITFEYYMQPYLNMTDTLYDTDLGSENDFLVGDITNETHEVAAGFSGTITLFNSLSHFDWGVPSTDADIIVSQPGNPNRAMVYCYDEGSAMVSSVAVAKRGAFLYWSQNVEAINNNGWEIFNQLLIWSIK